MQCELYFRSSQLSSTSLVYIIQVRPEIRGDTIADYNLNGRDWEWLVRQAVDSKATLDAHYVKVELFPFSCKVTQRLTVEYAD